MLLLAMLSVLAIDAATTFNVTFLALPEVVVAGYDEVYLECRYQGNFSFLSWFKETNEFFRYTPRNTPSTQIWPPPGVDAVKVVSCDLKMCRLNLGRVTEEASGMYRCDIERDVPPYKFATRIGYIQVNSKEHRQPQLEGLATEFGEGDEMKAYCRTDRHQPEPEIRWYINGGEIEEMQGSAFFKHTSSRHMYRGEPPKVTVQCAENHSGKLVHSRDTNAIWKERNTNDMRTQEQRNTSSHTRAAFSVIFILLQCFCITN